MDFLKSVTNAHAEQELDQAQGSPQTTQSTESKYLCKLIYFVEMMKDTHSSVGHLNSLDINILESSLSIFRQHILFNWQGELVDELSQMLSEQLPRK